MKTSGGWTMFLLIWDGSPLNRPGFPSYNPIPRWWLKNHRFSSPLFLEGKNWNQQPDQDFMANQPSPPNVPTPPNMKWGFDYGKPNDDKPLIVGSLLKFFDSRVYPTMFTFASHRYWLVWFLSTISSIPLRSPACFHQMIQERVNSWW